MSQLEAIENLCFGTFREYDDHIEASGGFDRQASFHPPRFSLSNPVLPMFDERWVVGPGQLDREAAANMRPAFLLASRFLTEKYPLAWFAHLCFGDRVREQRGTYIRRNSFSVSSAAISQVRELIADVGKTVIFMFDAREEEDSPFGETIPSERLIPAYLPHFDGRLPPRNRSAKEFCRPVIMLSRRFLIYFQRRAQPPNDEVYRVMFLLAVTLVHEFAHAFHAVLSPEPHEPRWSETDNYTEVGWSWERVVIGYGLQMFSSTPQDMQHKFLYQERMEEYHTSHEREQILRKFCGSNRTDDYFTCADSHGRIVRPPRAAASEFSHFQINFEEGAQPGRYIAARQIVPMKWVTAWFSEEKWQERAELWRREDRYIRPSLGNPFVVIYENNGQTASTLRPLNPSFPVDREILERRARGDHRL